MARALKISRLAALGVAAACGLAVMLALEGYLRLTGYSAREAHRPDRDLGWMPHPGRGVNSAGLRDRERLLDKPAGVYRVAVLGDAFSEAIDLAPGKAWWRLLEQRLQACAFQPGRRIEVLNFSVAGYGTAQQFVMLESRAIRYRPDLVLLQFNSADDLRNNSFALEPNKDRPFYMLQADGTLRIDDSFASTPAFRQRESLRAELTRRVRARSRLLQLTAGGAPLPPPDREVLAPPRERLWQEAWRITETLIAMTAGLAARNGARLALVSIPHPLHLQPGAPPSYADRRLARFAQRLGITALALPAAAAENHAAAADLVARHLCTRPGEPAHEPA